MTAKKKTAKRIVAKKVTKKKEISLEVIDDSKDDSALLENISSDKSDDVQNVATGKVPENEKIIIDDSELNPPASVDSVAIQKTKTKKSKGRPMKRSPVKSKKNKDDKPVNDTVTQLLKPDALKTIITIANNRLKESGSIWAMPDSERDDMADAVIAVIDKYFPEAAEWSVEATLILTASMYAIPRVMELRQKTNKESRKTEPVKEAEPTLEKSPPPAEPKMSADSRLDKYN